MFGPKTKNVDHYNFDYTLEYDLDSELVLSSKSAKLGSPSKIKGKGDVLGLKEWKRVYRWRHWLSRSMVWLPLLTFSSLFTVIMLSSNSTQDVGKTEVLSFWGISIDILSFGIICFGVFAACFLLTGFMFDYMNTYPQRFLNKKFGYRPREEMLVKENVDLDEYSLEAIQEKDQIIIGIRSWKKINYYEGLSASVYSYQKDKYTQIGSCHLDDYITLGKLQQKADQLVRKRNWAAHKRIEFKNTLSLHIKQLLAKEMIELKKLLQQIKEADRQLPAGDQTYYGLWSYYDSGLFSYNIYKDKVVIGCRYTDKNSMFKWSENYFDFKQIRNATDLKIASQLKDEFKQLQQQVANRPKDIKPIIKPYTEPNLKLGTPTLVEIINQEAYPYK